MNFASRRSISLLRYSIFYSKYLEFQSISPASRYSTNISNNQIATSLNKRLFVLDNKSYYIIRRFLADYPKHKVIHLPNLSPTMETGSVISWGRKEGEAVAEGDLLAEIETDKATMSLDADDDGFLAKIFVQAGTRDIPIGTPLCLIVDDEANVNSFKDFKPESKALPKFITDHVDAHHPVDPAKPAAAAAAPPPPPSKPVSQSTAIKPVVSGAGGERIFVSPFAKKLACDKGINIATIRGSGPGGRIVAADLEGVSGGHVAAAVGGEFPVDAMMAAHAQRLAQSKREIPHYHLTMEISMDRLLTARTKLNESRKDDPLSVTDFVVKAAAKACRDVPQANSEWRGTSIRQYSSVDVNVYVATPDGMINPVVHHADQKGLSEINKEVIDTIQMAREKKMQQDEGGTFTVTNLGNLGVTSFSAIINPPQCCVLAVGSSQDKIVLDSNSDKGFRKSVVMDVTLVCDHRVVDGAVGSQWLKAFRNYMEEPTNMLV